MRWARVGAVVRRDLTVALGSKAVVLPAVIVSLVLLVPVMVATVLAADGVAGEQERRTLEGLLLTPVTDRELATAKLLAAWLPAVVLGTVGAGLCAGVVHLTLGRPLGEVLLPGPAFLVLVLSPTGLAVAGLVAAALAVVLLRAATRALSRPPLGPRLG